jgi:pyruvate/2-oxoglutarate/acetoin dehydrogenase E1 component
MAQITVNQAISDALAEEMRRDPRVVMFGEGTATKRHELVEEFGAKRIRNTPLSEAIIAGTAAGAAATGLRPIIDLLFVPFICYSMDQIVNSAAKLRYISGGQFEFPMVVMALTGCGWTVGAQHNQNLESWFVHAPGLKVVMPSTADDFKGLLKSAIRDNNPVLFFTDMVLGYQPGEVPETEHIVPLGSARIRREGTDVTIISYAKMVNTSLQAAEELAAKGISAEVIDLRTLKPLDEATILASARKTGRVIIVHEASRMCGVGAEVSAIIAEHAFSSLKAPIVRVTGPDAPPPSSYALEQAFMPQPAKIVAAAEAMTVAVS